MTRHVTKPRRSGGRWANRRAGAKRATSLHETQAARRAGGGRLFAESGRGRFVHPPAEREDPGAADDSGGGGRVCWGKLDRVGLARGAGGGGCVFLFDIKLFTCLSKKMETVLANNNKCFITIRIIHRHKRFIWIIGAFLLSNTLYVS